jgi:hypothetical protein
MFMSAQPPTPPSAPPNEVHANWLGYMNDNLLSAIRTLVDNDETSMEHYLSQEGNEISPYQKASMRIRVIDMLVSP